MKRRINCVAVIFSFMLAAFPAMADTKISSDAASGQAYADQLYASYASKGMTPDQIFRMTGYMPTGTSASTTQGTSSSASQATAASIPAIKSNSGIDTAQGVNDLPLSIQGTAVVDITPTGILFPNGATMTPQAAQTLVNLVNMPACPNGTALSKIDQTTFSCVSVASTSSTDTSTATTTTTTPPPSAPASGTVVGGGNCSAYGMGTSEYYYGGTYISDCDHTCGGFTGGMGVWCPSTWTFWGNTSASGTCGSGSHSDYASGGTTYQCIEN